MGTKYDDTFKMSFRGALKMRRGNLILMKKGKPCTLCHPEVE